MKAPGINLFWKLVIIYVAVYYGALQVLFPLVSKWAVDAPEWLPMPAAALAMYKLLLGAGLFIYVASSGQRRREFLVPVYRFFGAAADGWRSRTRWGVLIAMPLVIGGFYFEDRLPNLSTPTGVRIQHPAMPAKFAEMNSPAREPGEAAVSAFMAGLEAEGEDLPSLLEARKQLIARNTREGATLFAINCRPCHGMQANGAGPMARGFRLKPADFRDPGLLPTVVESYAFWRVSKGGPGLPSASTPWDSAMPIWESELSKEQRWKVLLGEYFIAGVGPRETEKLE